MPDNEMKAGTKLQTATVPPIASAKTPMPGARLENGDDVHEPKEHGGEHEHALAHVGVAMGSGTDVAQESANVVLIGSDLSKLVEILQIARRCHRTIMQNFAGTLIVDTIGVGMAAFGFLNPLLAAFIHVSSEMVFILNSARLVPKASLAGVLAGTPPMAIRRETAEPRTA